MKYFVPILMSISFLGMSYAASNRNLPPINQIKCKLASADQIICNGFDAELFKIHSYIAKLKQRRFHTFHLSAGVASYVSQSNANQVILIFENADGWVRLATKNPSIGPDTRSGDWRELYTGYFICHSLTDRVYCPLMIN